MCEKCSEVSSRLPMAAAAAAKRLKIWELQGGLQCSIVGTCLTHEDLLEVAKRCRLEVQADAAPYDVHGYFVTEAGKAGPVARAVNKLLDRRYEGAIRKVSLCMCPDALGTLWDAESRAGRVAAAYWAVLSAAHAPDQLKTRIFGEVHMLSHLLGRSTHALAARASELDRRVADLEQRLQRESARHAAALVLRDAEIARLGEELTRSQRASRPDLTLCGADAERANPRSRRRLDRRERALTNARERARAAEAEVRHLQKRVRQMRAQLVRRPSTPPPCPAAEVCNAIVEADRRRILYLGGRQSAVEHLRALAAGANADLVHHDGGIEHAQSRIDGLIEGCDAIVCPIDCVSHSACRRAKALCRKYNKLFIPLRSSGTMTFARALATICDSSGRSRGGT